MPQEESVIHHAEVHVDKYRWTQREEQATEEKKKVTAKPTKFANKCGGRLVQDVTEPSSEGNRYLSPLFFLWSN